MNNLLKILLLPATLLYAIGVSIRNLFFDLGLLKAYSFPFPVICIGNLSAGGTGKTPHTEYIVEELRKKYRLAILSRGYKRNNKGFRIINSDDDASSAGDEPYQMFKKFNDVIIAVDEQRKRGIENLRKLDTPPQLIILDDAFQHRRVKAGLNILLTDYTKPYIEDIPLPSGRLRETRRGARRADIIVVTKSPDVLSPIEIRRLSGILNPEPYQKVFFSYIEYQSFVPLNSLAKQIIEDKGSLKKYSLLVVSAIANSKPLLLHLKRQSREIKPLSFSDHHYFKSKDYDSIKRQYEDIFSSKKAIVMTEKDAGKFDTTLFQDIPIFVLPIKIKFHEKEEEDFILEIQEHVRSYPGNL